MLLADTAAEMRTQLDDLLEGYSQFADFDYREAERIEPMRALRMMHYAAWLARRGARGIGQCRNPNGVTGTKFGTAFGSGVPVSNKSLTIKLFGLAVIAALGLLVFESLPETRQIVPIAKPTVAAQVSAGWSFGYLDRLQVVHIDGDRWLGIDDHHLFISEDAGQSFRRQGRLPKVGAGLVGQVKDRVARSKTVRLLRDNRGPGNVAVLGSGTILVFYDHLYRSADGGKTFEAVMKLDASAYPPYFPSGIAVGPDDTVYFGEYVTTPRPNRVRIFRGLNDGQDWEVAHEFPPGEIFHVHGVQYDPYRRGYWVLTGDRDEESAVLFTADDFRSLTPLGGGGQQWRVISLIITPDYLYWGSDDDINGADILRWDFATNNLEKMAHIGPPAYYSEQLENGLMVFSTAFEPGSRFTTSRQPDRFATLWSSWDGVQWEKSKAITIPFDAGESNAPRAQLRIPATPAGQQPAKLVLIPVNTSPHPHRTYIADVGNRTY